MVEFTLSHLSKNFKVDLYRYSPQCSCRGAAVTVRVKNDCHFLVVGQYAARLLVLSIGYCAIKSDAKSDLFTTGKSFGVVINTTIS